VLTSNEICAPLQVSAAALTFVNDLNDSPLHHAPAISCLQYIPLASPLVAVDCVLNSIQLPAEAVVAGLAVVQTPAKIPLAEAAQPFNQNVTFPVKVDVPDTVNDEVVVGASILPSPSTTTVPSLISIPPFVPLVKMIFSVIKGSFPAILIYISI